MPFGWRWRPRWLWAWLHRHRASSQLLILIVGRWIIRTLRNWVGKLLEGQAAQAVFEKSGLSSSLEPSGRRPAALVATLAYAFLMLMLWLIIVQILEIDSIVGLLDRLIAVLPLIFVAVALVLVAAAVANFVTELIRPYAEQRQIGWLPTVARVVIILFGVLAALDLLDIRFAEDIVKIVTAAAGIAFAVAFGVGGIDTAKLWWRPDGRASEGHGRQTATVPGPNRRSESVRTRTRNPATRPYLTRRVV